MRKFTAWLLTLFLVLAAISEAQVMGPGSGSGGGLSGPAGGGTTNVVARWTGPFTLGDTSPAITSDGTNTTWASGDLILPSAGQLRWSTDTILIRDAANVLALANSTTGQTLRIYNTRAGAGSGEWLSIDWDVIAGDAVGIMTRQGGAGSSRNIYLGTAGSGVVTFQTNSTDRWRIDDSGHLFPLGASSTLNLGSSSQRVLQGFFGTSGIDSTGQISSTSSAIFGAGQFVQFASSSFIRDVSDGILRLNNAAQNNFTRLVLGTNDTSGASFVKTGAALQVALGDGTLGGSIMGIPVAVQTIAAGNTITADACGTIKRISAGSAVTTDTTNTFTAPAAANAGCTMYVVNVGSFNITLDTNANFVSPGAADVVMTPNDAILVGSTGASGAWYALSALVVN